MLRIMFARFLGRQAAALIVALGVFLSGAAPAWAAPMSGEHSMPGMTMMMPGMAMDSTCMGGKDAPAKQAPCKSTDSSCAVCVACAVNVGLTAEISPVQFLYARNSGVFAPDVNPDGIASLPALPPPILNA